MTEPAGEWLVVHRTGRGAPELICEGVGPPRARDGERLLVVDGVLSPGAGPEAVLGVLRRSGPEALAGLRGRFTLVDWDGGSLHALRDPLGVRPLFWTRSPDGILVSPSAEALLRRPGVDRGVDRLFIAGHMLLGQRAHPHETPFAAVRRVPAGHTLTVQGGRPAVRRHWRPVARPVDPAERPGRFAALLEQAVERCTEGRATAVLLSGGLDSATVATAAARIARRSGLPAPHALSFLNPTPEADESPMQRRVARTLGMRAIAHGPDELIAPGGQLEAAIRLGEGRAFPAGLIQPAYDLMIERAVAQGAGSALLGDGGDEWLMPFSSWATGRLLRLDLPALRLMLQAWSYAYPPGEAPRLTRDVLWRWGARALLRTAAGHAAARVAPARYRRARAARLERRLPDWLAPDPALRRELLDWVVERAPDQPVRGLHEAAKDEVLVGVHTAIAMEDAVAASRRAGVEVLRPFWDVDLVEFLLGVPGEALIEGGRAKALARDYVAGDLPFAEEWPPKTYGESVVAHIVGREAAAWEGHPFDALSAVGLMRERASADKQKDARKISGDPPVMQLWPLISTETWLTRYL